MVRLRWGSSLPILITVANAATSPLRAQAPADSTTPVRLAVRAARLISPKDGKVLLDQVVLIENDRITRVGANLEVPKGARLIDLGSATLLPGLIDCHTHITGGDPGNYYERMFRLSPID